MIRCITAFNPNVITPERAGIVQPAAGITIWQVGNLGGATTSIGNSVVVDLRVVLNEGDTIETNNDADIDMTVSGYELDAP